MALQTTPKTTPESLDLPAINRYLPVQGWTGSSRYDSEFGVECGSLSVVLDLPTKRSRYDPAPVLRGVLRVILSTYLSAYRIYLTDGGTRRSKRKHTLTLLCGDEIERRLEEIDLGLSRKPVVSSVI